MYFAPIAYGFCQAVGGIARVGAELQYLLRTRDPAEHLKEIALQMPRKHTCT